MKRIIYSILISMFFISCKSIEIWNNYYQEKPLTTEQEKIRKIITIHGNVLDVSDRTSYLNYISLFDTKKSTNEGVKILEKQVSLKSDKEYVVNIEESSSHIEVYKQGIGINTDEFTVHVGKVQLENGKIIGLPPIKFKRYVYVYKINKLMDTLNQDTKESLFEGTIEEYREWKKKNK